MTKKKLNTHEQGDKDYEEALDGGLDLSEEPASFFTEMPEEYWDEELSTWEFYDKNLGKLVKPPRVLKSSSANKSPVFVPAIMKNLGEAGATNSELNFLRVKKGKIFYPYCLQSFKERSKQPTILQKKNRNKDTHVIGDCSGYGIMTGAVHPKEDWVKDRNFVDDYCKKIIQWYEDNCDEGVILDIPTSTPSLGKQPSITKPKHCLEITLKNLKVFKAHRGKKPLLNVLQTRESKRDADKWFNAVTKYQFEGWAIGGPKTMYNILYLVLKLQDKNLLEPPMNRLHIFGVGTVDWLVGLTAIQKHFPNVFISCDNASASVSGGGFGNMNRTPDPLEKIRTKAAKVFPGKTGAKIDWRKWKDLSLKALHRYDPFVLDESIPWNEEGRWKPDLKDRFRKFILDEFESPVFQGMKVKDFIDSKKPLRGDTLPKKERRKMLADKTYRKAKGYTLSDLVPSFRPEVEMLKLLHNMWAQILSLHGTLNIRNKGLRQNQPHDALWIPEDAIHKVMGSRNKSKTLQEQKVFLERIVGMDGKRW